MKNANAADERVAPFDQLEQVRRIGGVEIRMAPIFDRGAIAGFGDREDFESQFRVALEAAARVHADFMMALQRPPAQLRIDLRDKRALMSRVASIECDDARRVATFPRGLPCFNASARVGHRNNLTRRKDKWKRWKREHHRRMQQRKTGTGGACAPLSEILPAARVAMTLNNTEIAPTTIADSFITSRRKNDGQIAKMM